MRQERGLTLLEVLLAATVIGTMVVSASWAVGMASQARAITQEDSLDAALVAREVFELALGQDSVDDGDGPAKDAAGVSGLDSLDGASFSPPLDATGAELAMANPELWSQACDVQVYDLADLGAPVAEQFAGAAQSSSTLYRLTVSVSFRGQDQGSWWWWINP